MGPTEFVQADVELNCFTTERGGGGGGCEVTLQSLYRGEAVPEAPAPYPFVYHF